MKHFLVVANWKSYQTIEGAKRFIEGFKSAPVSSRLALVVCPPEEFLSLREWKDAPVVLGAQDLGHLEPKDLAALGIKYCLVGHSDRRKQGETEEDVKDKAEKLAKEGIRPLICFSKPSQAEKYRTYKLSESYIFCFEPPENISRPGIFKALNFLKIKKDLSQMRQALGKDNLLLYGGSVNQANVKDLSKIPYLDGFLVGQASLNYQEFQNLLYEL